MAEANEDDAGALAPIDTFFGPHRFLSSFWSAVVQLDGEEYPTVEHAYQAAKTADPGVRRQLRRCATPGEAKRRGSAIQPAPGWYDDRLAVMRDLVRQKFQHEDLRSLLVGTGAAPLIEGNRWGDRFWGMCDGTGTNHLGNLLMVERAAAADWPSPELALDLEGTLISNVVSVFSRPGLTEFLGWGSTRFTRVALYTAVSTSRSRAVVAELAARGEVPPWFADVEIVTQEGPCKDLRLLNSELGHLLLVDDQEAASCPAQRDRWVSVDCWDAPYPPDDTALRNVRRELATRLARLELTSWRS